tara:strand:- start:198 stop:578 length:381 start_codon:yes stop_codon:yes gene_type:complete
MDNQSKKMTDLLAEMTTIRDQLKVVQAEEKDLNGQKRELEYEIAIKMQEQGLEKVSNDLCTISVKAEMVPSVQDWDAVHQHIIDTNQFELLQKRMSATAWRELAKMGMEVPGVVGTELTRVNYRSK